MTQRKHSLSYTAEFRERGIRLFKENRSNYSSDNAAYKAIAFKFGCSSDSLRAWCQQAERDAGIRDSLSSEDIKRIFKASGKRYGARKIWHDLRREGKVLLSVQPTPYEKHGNTGCCAVWQGYHHQS